MRIVPCTLSQASQFVLRHHRHHKPPRGQLWAIALIDDDAVELAGVLIAGRPVSRVMQQRGWLEVLRLCVRDNVPNGCSLLYGKCRRISQAFGYCGVLTYTLASEGGASLKASGFTAAAKVKGRGWSCKSRPRNDQHPTGDKIRWISPAAGAK